MRRASIERSDLDARRKLVLALVGLRGITTESSNQNGESQVSVVGNLVSKRVITRLQQKTKA
jgi:hypothetical protein